MFTGIVEALGVVAQIKKESSNLRIIINAPFTSELKIDQSISHNGVCLTVVAINGDKYDVVAVDETLGKTNLGKLKVGDLVNLERSMKMGDRIDGHLVQGHVDCTAVCKSIKETGGSWRFEFSIDNNRSTNFPLVVSKGSICVNGVSLTVAGILSQSEFSVAIIPYTFEHTNFRVLKTGEMVNIELDVIGKYVQRILEIRS